MVKQEPEQCHGAAGERALKESSPGTLAGLAGTGSLLHHQAMGQEVSHSVTLLQGPCLCQTSRTTQLIAQARLRHWRRAKCCSLK